MQKINKLNPEGFRIVLVLQGGGALGAYQAGVYQALHENDLVPNWLVGTSIGAINAALLAGNKHENRLQRLRQFWNRVSHPDWIDLARVPDEQRRSSVWLSTVDTLFHGIPAFFTPRQFSLFPTGLAVEPETASFYDTAALGDTLDELVDFEYLNSDGIRLTVNAVNVNTGELTRFDNTQQTINANHVRASGALPPGFPPVRIDGQLYWDGGLYSNTPLETVFEDLPHIDTLCFMVDLWSANGPEPTTLEEVQTREKDVTFASRSKRHIENYLYNYKLQCKLRELYSLLPEHAKTTAGMEELATLGADSTLHIVRLVYAGHDWHMASKDINFSTGSINWRWDQGYRDAMRVIEFGGWLKVASKGKGLVVHDLPQHAN